MSRAERKETGTLEVTAPNRRKHATVLIDLIGKVFAKEAGYYTLCDFGRGILLHGTYDWAASRIGLIDGRIVTHWGVCGYTMRIGGARVRVGGVTCVATDAEYRKRGLMDRTGRASLGAMRAAGYDMTMLFGIDDFYDRFGYVNAWSPVRYHVNVSELPSGRPGAAPRKFALRTRDDMVAMYNRAYAGLTGTAVRPTFRRAARAKIWEGYAWHDARGAVAGYVVTCRHRGALVCVEYCGDAEQALRVLATLAARWRCRDVWFTVLHDDTPLCKRLRRGNCRVETHRKRSGGPMVRTLNLSATLGKLTREFARRLKRSHMAGWRGEVLIADPRERVTLAINRSTVSLAPARGSRHGIRGGEGIAQLIIGSDEPGEIVEAAGIRVTGDARTLIEVLFPNQHPRLCALDEY